MSRIWLKLTEDITVFYGEDHALGDWLDIQDSRVEAVDNDEMNEGYVYENSQMFPNSTNVIDIPHYKYLSEVLENKELVIQKCNEYYERIK